MSSQNPSILGSLCQGENPSLDWSESSSRAKETERMEESESIGRYMRKLLELYETVRGRKPQERGVEFWDCVVVSAADTSQEEWYNKQIQLKLEKGELPLVPYLCIADPEGPRIGSGGSTLHILSLLDSQYPGRLDEWRVLIIHAGGYSKRLPSHSCAGKIFSPLPISLDEGPPYQMLDLKLAMYLPFLSAMKPGIFITASDDIEVFRLSVPLTLEGSDDCITALAHPSSLFIGTTHGVYVMDNKETLGQEKCELHEVRSCLEVLQKPSVDLMRRRGAVLDRQGEETVYSDSAFWLDAVTTRKLISLHSHVFPLSSELCIYGDLLTCLGEREDKEYVDRLYRETQEEREGVCVKRAVCESVRETHLQVVTLHSSKFYHLGTIQEYLHGLTANKHLRMELNLKNIVCSEVADSSLIQGIVLNSILHEPVSLAQDSILEYSVIHCKTRLGPRTILSSVEVQDSISIPPGFLYHTVPVCVGENRGFVTVAFHHTDDMKYTADIDHSEDLQYGGKLLQSLYSVAPETYRKETVFHSSPASLWNAKLFTSHPTMGESFLHTVRMVSLLDSKTTAASSNSTLYSMDDLVKMKDCQGILEFRKKLISLYRS